MPTQSYWGDQAMRLIRTKWANPNLLAEELYAIFKSMFPPDGITDRVRFVQNGEEPVIQIISSDDPDNPPIEVLDPNGDPIPTDPGTGDPGNPEAPPPAAATSGVVLGTIVGGSGSFYTVNINGSNVEVEQGQILSTEIIPAGTVALVGFSGPVSDREYFMQVPVWL